MACIPTALTGTLRRTVASNVCETAQTNDLDIPSIIARLVVFFLGEAAAWCVGAVGTVVVVTLVGGIRFVVELAAFHVAFCL